MKRKIYKNSDYSTDQNPLQRFEYMAGFLERLKKKSGKKCLVMGILNITPDSFSDGGNFLNEDAALEHALEMIADGADIIDLGAESTRPGSRQVPDDEQVKRILPVLERIRKHSDVPVSVDSTGFEVIRRAVNAGADIVNDISALRFDEKLAGFVAENNLPVILMHMQGNPQTMQNNPVYADVLGEVCAFLRERVDFAISCGIKKENIIVDPGFGFGKNLKHNIELMAGLASIKKLGFPVLLGISRKRMIGEILGVPVDQRLTGGLALNILGCLDGADIVRVHDVRETCQALKIVETIADAKKRLADV